MKKWGIKGANPVLGIFYLTEDWKLRFRKISLLMVPYYRTKIWKRKRFVCLECGRKFLCLVKKDSDNPPCHNCEGNENGNFLIKLIEEI